jgi:predicted hydrolase (HD superfamily)
VDRYQLVVNGWEVVNAYSELIDPLDQRARFEAQARAREAGDEEALELDEDYLEAMEYGMPPMSGWGMGVDRFVALLTDQDNLREAVLFPLMRPREPGAGASEAVGGQASPPTASAPQVGGARDAIGGGAVAGGVAAAGDTESPVLPADLLGHPVDDVEDLGITEARARALFDEWVVTPSLRRQMEQSAVVMAALARRLGANEGAWRLLGLLHNLDFDRVKEPERHTLVAAAVLRREGMHPGGIHAICAHTDDGLAHTGIRCTSRLDHAVSCAEAVVGLIHAASQVLPSKDVQDLELPSLLKRFSNPRFAVNVERRLIDRCQGLDLDRETFLALALEALKAAG